MMFTKKNYKQEQHFSNYYSITIPTQHGDKSTFYFKRHIPNSLQQSQHPLNIYQLIRNPNKQHLSKPNNNKQSYPIDRTLEVITFDSAIKLEDAKIFFRKLGKIRKYITGQSTYRNRDVYYIIIVYKFQFDLVKAFREDYLQTLINDHLKSMAIDQEDIQNYRVKIINDHLNEEMKAKMEKIKQLKEQGFQMVTDRYGNFKVDYQSNIKFTQNLPQIKKKKKQQQKKERQKAEEIHQQ